VCYLGLGVALLHPRGELRLQPIPRPPPVFRAPPPPAPLPQPIGARAPPPARVDFRGEVDFRGCGLGGEGSQPRGVGLVQGLG